MATDLPSQRELRCAGISFIISQIAFLVMTVLFSIDYDVYNVQKEQQLLQLHEITSSAAHRTEIEIAVSCIWLSVPFLLASLYGIHKLGSHLFEATPVEMVVYMIEKSYIIFITISGILVPAVALVAVSYEWSFHQYTPTAGFISTGYYIQLYIMLYQFELIDCLAIADATFMISVYFLPIITLFGASRGNLKLKKVLKAMTPTFCGVCAFIICGVVMGSFVFVFMLVLFEFARSGFHSPTGKAKYLLIWSLIWKIMIGVGMIRFGGKRAYNQLKMLSDNIVDDAPENEDEDQQMSSIDEAGGDSKFRYNMDTAVEHLGLDLKAVNVMAELNPVTPMYQTNASPL